MVGDEAVRFCCVCSKNVYDLSAMDSDSAEAFLQERLRDSDGDAPCVRLFRRPDGRVLTSECAAGQRGRHARRTVLTLAASLAATTLAIATAEQVTRPTLNPEPCVWDEPVHLEDERSQFVALMGTGAVREREDASIPAPVPIDEVALADQAEAESEFFGTAARTARAVSERRATRDPVLPGTVRLVKTSREL